MKKFSYAALPLAIASLSVSGLYSSQLLAQEESSTAELEEVIITGTRGKPRTVSDSPVPVDVFGSDDLESVSFTDTNDILQTLVPSFALSRSPIADGASFIRPATLRGMPTDKTLVLVNNKRRHRSALVQIGGSGTQGPDIATIPASALKSVEVLRDGAASLYGSDAIAGVINFILKDNTEGGSITVDAGEHYEGDGFMSSVSGNIGLPLGDTGFLSISGEVSTQEFTSRSEQYCEPWFCVTDQSEEYQELARSASLEGDVVQPWGQPNTDAARLFFNAGFDLSDSAELYAFGNYSESEGDGSFFYRYPGNGTIEDLRNADGSIYSPLEKFPGGFTPRFFGEVTDYSLVTGIKGDLTDSFSYDVSGRYGFDEISYTLKNTINPSLGIDSPTSFKPGDLSNEEIQLQADFSYAMTDTVTLSFGASYMEESYDVQESSDEDSYRAGPHATSDPYGFCNDEPGALRTATEAGEAVIANGSTLDCAAGFINEDGNYVYTDPVYTVVGVGSNGFPGYSPAFSDLYERDSLGLYVELSADITDDFLVQTSLRYEDYSDFDSEVVGQLAGKYNVTDTFGIRASVGTGFRAPTPGQQGTTNVSTRLPNGFPVATGLFPAGGTVAQALGAQELEPETSTSFTFGFTGDAGPVSYTVDFYRIEVADRTYAISTQDVSSTPGADGYDNFLALQAAGVAGAESIGGVFYFANAFDTVTSGVDVVLTTPIDWDNGSVTDLTASFNFNSSEFDSDPSGFLNIEDEFDFENGIPEIRGVFTARHTIENLTLVARANYYGSYEESNRATRDIEVDGVEVEEEFLRVQDYDPVVMFDLEGSYQINETFRVTVGGRNIFDEYPEEADEVVGDYCCGRVYSSNTIVPWQGGYYFMRLDADF